MESPTSGRNVWGGQKSEATLSDDEDNQGGAAAVQTILAEIDTMTLDDSRDDDGDCSSMEHACSSDKGNTALMDLEQRGSSKRHALTPSCQKPSL